MLIQPEPTNGSQDNGAHYVCIFDKARDAYEHRKALSAERRAGGISADVRHRVTARTIKVDGAQVVVWCVTERKKA